MKYSLNLHTTKLDEEEILADLQNVAKALGKSTLSIREYEQIGKYSARNIQKRFEGWNLALKAAGLEVGLVLNISEEELFKNLEHVWTMLGRQPTWREMKRPLSPISSGPYLRKFGSWNKALTAFINYLNQEKENSDMVEEVGDITLASPIEDKSKKRTHREINDRSRFRILMRDGFTCVKCGRSPIKERDVELHIDHIIPWSKGGETVPENLETKCSKCNLGKGNAFQV